MMSLYKKVVISHAGARDSYQLAIAFEERGLLTYLVTDIYLPRFLGLKYGKRFSNELPWKRTVSSYLNILLSKIFRQPYTKTDSRLSKRAFRKAVNTGSNLFLYSYTANEAFSAVKKEGLPIKCFFFQLHPHPISIRKLLKEEILLVPSASASILSESEMDEDMGVINRLAEESLLADHCMVASSYTKQTLVENGIDHNRITVIPYGVDFSRFPAKKEYSTKNGSINIIFVGQMIQRKGLYYLLEAVKKLKSKDTTLTLVGRGTIDVELLNEYKTELNLLIKTNLGHDDLVAEMHKNDVLVFPSLCEGFGHVILEAMSAGLPVICTRNTAGPDVFKTGKEGVIVPIRDIDALAEQIAYFINNKAELADMGRAAASTARQFTWQKFRKDVFEFYCAHSN